MVSLRFPFLFSQPMNLPGTPQNNHRTTSPLHFSATFTATASVGAAAAAGVSVVSQYPKHPFLQNAANLLFSNHSSLWGSLFLADGSAPIVESKSGVSFPPVLGNSLRLLGVGLRKKSILGLKNIDVYDLGIEEHRRLCICAYEESVGSRLQKFGGSDNEEQLQRFTSQFKDEYKVPRGSVIDLSKERGHILKTTIDGKEVGSIQSKLLCRSILDLYIGEEPFDRRTKEDVELNVASFLQK